MFTKVDHIGIAVSNLDNAVEIFELLFRKGCDAVEHTEDGKTRIAIFKIGESKIELLESRDETSVISKFIAKRGEGLHHIAFEVKDINASIKYLLEKGMKMIDEKPRKGVGGTKIAFIHPKQTASVLVELVEK
jgi:methylmalonyl-CoA/ethylmalonyl-CoA epimerase